jgi:riboflavin biosynthesis pyrimidine reductase
MKTNAAIVRKHRPVTFLFDALAQAVLLDGRLGRHGQHRVRMEEEESRRRGTHQFKETSNSLRIKNNGRRG